MAFFERFLKPASNSSPPAPAASSPRSGGRDAATVASRRPPSAPAPLVDPHDRPTFVTGRGPKPPALPVDAGDDTPPVRTDAAVEAGRQIQAEQGQAQPRATVVNPQALKRALDSERNFVAIAEEPGARVLSRLARSFPSLEEAPGTDPWEPRRLVAWLNDPARNEQAWWAGCFVLGVAEPETDWTSFGLRRDGRFDVFRAAGAWDVHHREAFAAAFADCAWIRERV